MATIRIDPSIPGPQLLAHAASILRRGGLVAFPTETVYGLGANALDAAAVARIFAAKGRPDFNPLIVHVTDTDAAREYTTAWPEEARALAAAFWPGPITLVLPKRDIIPDVVTAGLPSVALRVPSHPVARALLRAAGIPIAAPSANRYTELSPTTAAHVERALGDRGDLVRDGGPTRVGIESTVVDLSGPTPTLLRPGSLAPAALRAVVGPLEIPDNVIPDDPTVPRRSPGLVARHYAPRARLRLFDASERGDAAAIAERAAAGGESVGALLLAPLAAPVRHVVRMPADPAAYAHALYAALHRLDDDRCDLVLVERVPSGEAWAGVRDRLERAATT
ncbi:MAG: L-threonylcarbamoyladenylate synthase [Gemmatimonadaceae bacterium]